MITHTTTVEVDGEVRTYTGTHKFANKAKFLAEKKARTFLRRRKLSVKMENVKRTLCPDCPQKTGFVVHDLVVPPRQEIEDDKYDFLLSSNWNL